MVRKTDESSMIIKDG